MGVPVHRGCPFLVALLLWCGGVVAAAAPIPVANGDFEAGLEGWALAKPADFRHGEATVETQDVHAGARAIRLTNEPEGDPVLIGLTNPTPIALPDQSRAFSVSLWMKIVRAPQMIELRIASTDREGKTLTPWQEKGWRFLRPPLEPHLSHWQQFTGEFVAQDEWGGVVLTFWVNGAAAEVLLDDLTIEPMSPDRWVVPSVGSRLPEPAPGVALWWEGPLRKVYPFETEPESAGEPIRLFAAGDEGETVQVCLRPERDVPNVSVAFSEATGPGMLPASAWRANFVGLVPVDHLTSARGVLGPTPDPLLPDRTLTLPAGETTAIWVTLHVPPGTPAGDYEARAALEGDGLSAQVPLRVHVYGFDLPERPTLRTIARIWQSHPGYENLFLQNLQEHRCAGTGYIGGVSLSNQEGRLIVDVSKLPDAIAGKLAPFGFQVFNVPSIFLGDASGWYAKDGQWQGFTVLSPEFDRAFADYCRQVGEALRAEGVLDHAIWQIWDEPQDEAMRGNCRHLAELVKSAVPDARIYLTAGVIDELLDLVDIWCLPWPSTYSEEAARRAREHGAELWAYENDLYSLDVPDSSLLLRSFPWRLRRYDIRGVEWWAISQWKTDPWTVPNQYEPQNGGGFFLYPTPDRTGPPIDSLRWECYREGVEDYDLLTMLAEAQRSATGPAEGAPSAADLTQRVALGVQEVSRDPLAITETKREVCEALERLDR